MGLSTLFDFLFGLSQSSLEVFSLYGRATGSMVGLMVTFSKRTYATKLRLPGLLLTVSLTLCQAAVNPLLCRRLPNIHRQVWLSLLWERVFSSLNCVGKTGQLLGPFNGPGLGGPESMIKWKREPEGGRERGRKKDMGTQALMEQKCFNDFSVSIYRL